MYPDHSPAQSTAPGDAGADAGASSLPMPSAEALLEGVLTLGREVHLEMDEPATAQLFLATLRQLFPQRAIAIRVLAQRVGEALRCYSFSRLRAGLEREPIVLRATSVEKSRLKRSARERAGIVLDPGWASPFSSEQPMNGFAVPLVASGMCYGVFDVGYPEKTPSATIEADERVLLPVANQLSVALRNQRLHHDSAVLRDYQAKLIEHAGTLIVGIDRDWHITVCNRALCQLIGRRPEDMVGRDLRELLVGDELPALTRQVRTVLDGGSVSAVDATLKGPAGQPVRTLWNATAIRNSSDEVEAVVAVGQDLTAILDLQSQVIQAEKLATLGQLAAGVVHELNNPLTSIVVYASYLEGKLSRGAHRGEALEVDPGDVEKLRRIGASAQRISNLARELVQYAKPAHETVERVSINHVVLQALSLCEHLFENGRVHLARELAGGLPPVRAIPGQLEQIVINLVTNAVHAVDGEGTVTVRTAAGADEAVVLAVADTGSGVAEDLRARIFEPFFTTKTEGRGTGLGLSIVHGIVERHEGSIEVGDEAGGGALFSVTLPTQGRPA
ncbi:two-component system sensor histidine kinase NtrB [Haliangium ochraceum]|uniref:histidine kinase n=1 Tax=Haliangium ochraceum (strain DSM 14365 / JCM 11303 / SMP-2) TaxID=502025 RepID=D0LKQ0_HALO1|nr:ATP-binding protein [Haliangium ochraceum]ACY15098.1 PAS/PAC sensor signal transduction histidine kinase [Haliangium ochraceum DSM 14365]